MKLIADSEIVKFPFHTPDPSNSNQNIELLKFIFKILSDFWFNECVPRDFQRTILRSFLKNNDKSCDDHANYRPISLLNFLMKIY